MSNIKLTYFNVRGRGEIVRLVFAAAGIDYEDIRIEREQWPALKPSTPFGQLPVCDIDGVRFCQRLPMARYIARKYNLAGKTELDQVRADMIIDCIEDTIVAGVRFHFEADPTRKAEMKKKYHEEQLPTFLDNLEKLLKANNGGDGFFVGSGLTWADIGIVFLAHWLPVLGADDYLAKRPKLFALQKKVEAVPKIAAYLAKRPKTDL